MKISSTSLDNQEEIKLKYCMNLVSIFQVSLSGLKKRRNITHILYFKEKLYYN